MGNSAKIFQKIKNDPAFKNMCIEFFQIAERASSINARNEGRHMLMRNSQMFYVDDASNTKLHNLLRASVKKLGPSFGNTKEVDRLLWRIVCHEWSLSADQKATKFIECLGDHAKSEYTYICANQLFRIRSKTRLC